MRCYWFRQGDIVNYTNKLSSWLCLLWCYVDGVGCGGWDGCFVELVVFVEVV